MARRRRSKSSGIKWIAILKWFLYFVAFGIVFNLIATYMSIAFAFVLALVFVFVGWEIYELAYFNSKKFLAIKGRIQAYIDDCNALNRHIEELKDTHLESNRLDLGAAQHQDNSKWSVKRPKMQMQKYAPNVYNCSKTVLANARNKPFDYICKYFAIRADEETLEKFESILNNFEAAEDGKIALRAERENILASIQSELPMLIKKFSKKKIASELGFDAVDFDTVYFPQYEFIYVSPGGNVGDKLSVVMDIEQLNKFIVYLSEKIKFKKSAAGQRALMTSKLREQIKERDMYTCQECGISVQDEPHLLLEIDHIVPVSRGGLTTEDNLQTLCWKCNRTKGARVDD